MKCLNKEELLFKKEILASLSNDFIGFKFLKYMYT